MRAFLLMGLLLCSSSWAELTFTNLISCAPAFAGLVGPCTLQSSPLVLAQSYETDFKVRYHFDCRYQTSGVVDQNYLKIGISGGDVASRARINYNGAGEVNITGRGPLVLYDEMPTWTAIRRHNAGCNLTVSVERMKPSLNTLNEWHRESLTQTRILLLLLERYLISKRFDVVVNWNSSQLAAARANLEQQLVGYLPGVTLEQIIYPLSHPDREKRGRLKDYVDMPQAWKDAIIFTPQLPDIVIMLSQVRAIIDGQPPVYSPADTQRYREELMREIEIANQIIARANQWLELLTAEMREAVDNLIKVRNKANQEGG